MNEVAHNWWQEAVVYQVYLRSFQDSDGDGIGDIQGLINRLDYIMQLGVDVIWLNPIYQSPNDDNGYDISDYYKVLSEFGTMEDFDELLLQMHKRGLKLMMDLVVNHTSDEHEWFIKSKNDKSNQFHDYYIWRDSEKDQAPTNWRSEFGGSAWEPVPDIGQSYLHLFSKKQPDLNWDNPSVRQDIYSMMDWWCKKGVDGFRMDVINAISKPKVFTNDNNIVSNNVHASSLHMVTNGPHVHEYLEEMNQKVLSKYDLITVGETPDVTPEIASQYAGFDKNELQMVFQFEHMGLDNDPKMGKWSSRRVSLIDLKNTLTKWQIGLAGKAWNSLYWNNHDQPRVVSRFGNDNEEYRVASAKMLANTLHMMQGTPYIYQGEEIGMTNVEFENIDQYRDLDTINAYRELVQEKKEISPEEMMRFIHLRSRDNARTPMQWDADINAGFSTGSPWIGVNKNYTSINVEAALSDPNSVCYFYRQLIELRRKYPIIVYGSYELLLKDNPSIYAYHRKLNNEELLVLSNFTAEVQNFPSDILTKNHKFLIGNYESSDLKVLKAYETRTYLRTDS